MSEEWKPVTGYEGLYEVSNQGRVRSLPKKVRRPHTRPYTTKLYVLKGRVGNKHGHIHVILTDHNGKARNHWVHRLVALEWCDRLPGQDYVLHGPEGPAVNRADHLRWGTHAENDADKDVHRTRPIYMPPERCSAGHLMTEENTYRPPKRPTNRLCRECQRKYNRDARARRKAKV